jgi:hypothetical protein
MSVDYDQLKAFVKEAMFTGGGINEPSAPEGVPHRMPASNTDTRAQDKGDPKANELYDVALAAREATEILVEKLDEPIYDGAYEHAFKASACLRRALNELVGAGAHPMPMQHVVAPPKSQQRYNAGGGSNAGDYFAGASGMLGMPGELAEQEKPGGALKGFGTGVATRSAQAQATKQKGAAIGAGDVLAGVDDRERKILLQIEDILTKVADKTDLVKYRPILQTFLAQFLKKVEADPGTTAAAEPE